MVGRWQEKGVCNSRIRCRSSVRRRYGIIMVFRKDIQKFYTQTRMESIDESDNSGVFVRFPDPDNNPNNAVRERL